MTVIKSNGFVLRPVKLSDAEPFFETMQDKLTKKNLASVPKTLSEAKSEIRSMIKEMKEKGSEVFTIEVNGKYAGNVILQYQNWDQASKDGRIHMWLHPKFRGTGLSKKSLNTLIKYGFKKFTRIYAQCKAINKRMIELLEELNIKKVKTHNLEGVKRILWVKERIKKAAP